jgi:hypothetical protein
VVVARDARNLLGLEAEELADPVVLVDHMIAGAQVGERLERPPDPRRGAWLAAEDLRVGQKRDAEVTPDETAPCRGDRVEQVGLPRQLVPLLEEPRLDAAEEVLVAQRLAAVRERDHDP